MKICIILLKKCFEFHNNKFSLLESYKYNKSIAIFRESCIFDKILLKRTRLIHNNG